MTVVEIVDKIVDWARAEICERVSLKMPPEDDNESNSAGYEYKLITPAVFPFFVPSREKLPPSILSPIPSLWVKIVDGEDDLTRNTGSIKIEFCLATWNPGVHGKDYFFPDEKDHSIVHQWTGKKAEAYFERRYDGWRDAWNWLDVTLRAVESTHTINGIEIDRSAGVKFYPLKEQEAISDLYPFWFACVQFAVKRPIVRNIPEYNDLL